MKKGSNTADLRQRIDQFCFSRRRSIYRDEVASNGDVVAEASTLKFPIFSFHFFRTKVRQSSIDIQNHAITELNDYGVKPIAGVR